MSVIESVVAPVRPPAPPPRITPRIRLTHLSLDKRGVRITLAVLWLLDGALQLQPDMFTTRFARQVVAPAATDQPGWVTWPVLHSAHLIASHPFASDLGFASVQLVLGLLLLFPRTARAGLLASIAWAAGVWAVGEGFGGIAGGTASALTGAPGAALLYGMLAVAAWPRATSLSGRGRDGPVGEWFAGAWAALWVGLGLSALLPANRSAGRVADQLTQVAGTVPGWLSHVDHVVAGLVRSSGWAGVALLTVIPAAVGITGLGSNCVRRVAAWAGIVLAIATWVVGESFGQLGSGIATDPNTGPLLVVAAFALMSTTNRRSARER